MLRIDGRRPDELRPVSIERGVAKFAEGSCLIKMGDTHMLVTATVEDGVPRFLKGQGQGWVTAEYAMLPRSGKQRNQRDANRGPNGRSMEIQRLIGRCLRSVVNMKALGERTVTLDCDALQADGGTRTAAITAAYVALQDAISWMMDRRMIKSNPLQDQIAAISVGIVGGTELLDLCYEEDSRAATDMNIIMTGAGKFVEVQGTAEADPFSGENLLSMLKLGHKGIQQLVELQKSVLAQPLDRP